MINSQQKYNKNKERINRLRIILAETGFRQNQLAEAGSVKPTTLNGYLSGARPVGFDFAYAIMKSLGYNPFWTLFGDGGKKVPMEIYAELTPENHERFEEIERDRVFMRQIDESGMREDIERILELSRSDKKLFRIFFDRLFPEKHD
ncbi:DNA-binding helix-turn-helix protein [Leptospira interrogans serovar Valbuzzi str. Duyster]|uniref:helix-turn-helix domain-containing protein n=1 Tax=Leptospira interrogans TaxID=173 RepID=UPI0002BA219C|nr:helix-turn-helix transcriptional regulator [Leptospira interrogans]EMJ52040.1 DNA-binding helix-turn-helix protein [Leptospira interrogans serovar Valbuzzi str. Duyster]EMJ53704.1 DNA-binding helix-turn-helix protein [Leptospira interrogans serovar Valbuzzi str. Duyster]EMJ54755.1 DNA-binding helix-turn-helix protein [Leptospira interrogans serovar Valbuzzi str. Duyster]EMJ54759.1 DNA-binding helix-turn-helix protein [Leptospira interrogans serovar Valbuzzi str. Duyster]EMJ55402.1 DNA-bindi